ncbi:MAG: 50S ribosomal protein L19 [Dehalococcoidia bacterium]|nr:MAG: 50S ribosomal protein L19 [Dehalococcoidia bacterium]
MDIASVVDVKLNPKIQAFAPGDTVKVSNKVVEGDRERTQVFQGVVIRVRRGGAGASFTVRRVAYGVGVERTFLLNSPLVEKVEIVRHGKVRRAKLYYLRGLSAKASRIKEKQVGREKEVGETEPEEPEPEPEPEQA